MMAQCVLYTVHYNVNYIQIVYSGTKCMFNMLLLCYDFLLSNEVIKINYPLHIITVYDHTFKETSLYVWLSTGLCGTFIPCILGCKVAQDHGDSCCLPFLPGALIALRTSIRDKYQINVSLSVYHAKFSLFFKVVFFFYFV